MTKFLIKHDAEGKILSLSEYTGQSDAALPENSIVVSDISIFDNNISHHVRVINNSLTVIDPHVKTTFGLKPSSDGFRTVRNHAALLLEPDETYPTIQYFQQK